MPGPVPKRSSQRRRRNHVQVDRIPVRGAVEAPPLDLDDVHPLATAMYEALAKSAQAYLYGAVGLGVCAVGCFCDV